MCVAGYESVAAQDKTLAADPAAALAKGGLFSGNLKLRPEWDGCKQQANCSIGGTIGCVFRAAPTATQTAAALTRALAPATLATRKNEVPSLDPSGAVPRGCVVVVAGPHAH